MAEWQIKRLYVRTVRRSLPFLLLLGCITFINLTTAQASQRAKEIGIRKTMGRLRYLVDRSVPERDFPGHTYLQLLLPPCLTPCHSWPVFSDFIAKGIKADLIHRPDVILFLALLAVVVNVYQGLYPALVFIGL